MFIRRVFLSLNIILLASCGGGSNSTDNPTNPPPPVPEYEYLVPEQVAGSWSTAHVSTVNINQTRIETLFNQVVSGNYPLLHSILIIRNSTLVVEEYFSGKPKSQTDVSISLPTIQFDKDTLHYQASATKSFVSAMVGIAKEQGLISGVEQLINTIFTDHLDLFEGTKNDITIANLLTMQSGIQWQEGSTATMAQDRSNWVEFVLGKPMVSTPGESFLYNSGLSVL